MWVAIGILALLALSVVATGLGIWWTARPVIRASPDDEGVFELTTHDTTWERVRGLVALGVGLILNTAASAVGAFQTLISLN